MDLDRFGYLFACCIRDVYTRDKSEIVGVAAATALGVVSSIAIVYALTALGLLA